ncbi:MAG TPA: hypothetical protein VLG76_03870 [Rhabdochlamydiaceae bacterium]|nr:hypothetical protein [Rhabdochlamydiaceae bacterium]
MMNPVNSNHFLLNEDKKLSNASKKRKAETPASSESSSSSALSSSPSFKSAISSEPVSKPYDSSTVLGKADIFAHINSFLTSHHTSRMQRVSKTVNQSKENIAAVYKCQLEGPLANIKTVDGQSAYILDIIRSIRKSGGVNVSPPVFDCITQFSSREISNEDLPFLRRICPNIVDLDLSSNGNISDVGLAHLARRPLQKLNLSHTRITNDGLAHLSGTPLLELDLSATQITNAGLTHLAGMPLQELFFAFTRVTNTGLAHLSGMPLRKLDLSFTPVTYFGLTDLAAMPFPEEFQLSPVHSRDRCQACIAHRNALEMRCLT